MEQEERARKDKMAAQAAKLAELQEAKRKKEEEKEEEEDGEEKKRREEEQQKVIIPPNKPDGPGISPLTLVHLCIVKMHKWKEDCTETKHPFMYFQKRNCASSVPISTFMCL
jgi:hypothetical protein